MCIIMDELISLAEDLAALRQRVVALQRREIVVAREVALEAHLKRIVEAMQPIGARLVVSDGLCGIEVADADNNLIWWQYFRFPQDVLKINPDKWPNFEKLVRRWECARPTPRAGDYRDRKTWTSPGRLIATQWNGRKPGREWDV
jgi:hypothetical protein